MRSRFLQSQLENERLKKELVEANIKVSTQSTPQSNPVAPTIESIQSKVQPISSVASNEAQPPTAYITPSRITKIHPSPQQQQQLQQSGTSSQSSSTLMLRRTVAVQPTLHDSAPTQSRPQTHLAMMGGGTPNEEAPVETNIEPQSVAPTTSSGIAKRTREEEQ